MQIGIDEVGRGAWAGPLLVVAARQKGKLPKGLTDSKLLTKPQRQAMFELLPSSFQFGEGWVTPDEVDSLGLTQAMRLAVSRALAQMDAQTTDEIVIDGHINYCGAQFQNVRAQIKADRDVPLVAAASIYAKVLRDAYMAELAEQYDAFGFEANVGYGTKQHQAALARYGPSKVHRLSYKPVAACA